ncbi:MAG: hypothetical protein NVS4B12_11820 [Ktedonobacteraceae bacterium]
MQQRSPMFFALIVLGVVLLLVGVVYGLGSRHVQYKSVGQGSIAHYLSADGTGYFQMEGNPALYIVHEDNFSPKLAQFADSDTVSFVYDPSETTAIDVTSKIGTHLTGTASKVVEIAYSDTDGMKIYTTPEYTSNSQGYDHNQWPIGIGLLIVGLLLIGGSFFLPKKKTLAIAAASHFTGTPMQMQQPRFPQQQGPSPYGQQPQQTNPTPSAPMQPNYQSQEEPFQQLPLGQPQQQEPLQRFIPYNKFPQQ